MKHQFKVFNMAGLFVLYRGASMLEKWIQEYKKVKENEDFKIINISGS